MKKILFPILVVMLLVGLGLVGYNYFQAGSNSRSNQSGGPPNEAQLCKVDSHTCTVIPKSANSGAVKITISASGKSVGDLEVDLGTKPGAPQYYMKLTDANGTAIFDGIPAGSYVIYFNSNNFPQQFGSPPTETVTVGSGQTSVKNIDLLSK